MLGYFLRELIASSGVYPPGGFCEGRMTELAYSVGSKHDGNEEGNYWTKYKNP